MVGLRVTDKNIVSDERVHAVWAGYAEPIRLKLREVRVIIQSIVIKYPQIGDLQETLKWGQLSYLPVKSGIGSTIRIAIGIAIGIAIAIAISIVIGMARGIAVGFIATNPHTHFNPTDSEGKGLRKPSGEICGETPFRMPRTLELGWKRIRSQQL